ncbi:hypothetical protein OG946_15445 [Streptomyces sp. NBC_01808]|uniref:hypothetical protein n=1 Tax=Streptomyces sp. NBC_01808 TaxID=2975947 RepID=UPI002DDBE2E8|nr:hypothetical protein [Streptomyces sp. NBC_01808]WSA38650.1 hypothetical protein OG946_15445 [Streptomyces sp. NBC_01808]
MSADRPESGAGGSSGTGGTGGTGGSRTERAAPGPVRRLLAPGPLPTLVLLLASFALTGYAGVRLFGKDPLGVALWLAVAAVLHDLALLPLYSLADRGAQRVLGPRLVNYVRFPAAVSGLLLLVCFPLITRQVGRYETVTALPADAFLYRWLLITAALFAASALVLAARRTVARPRSSGPPPASGPPPRT